MKTRASCWLVPSFLFSVPRTSSVILNETFPGGWCFYRVQNDSWKLTGRRREKRLPGLKNDVSKGPEATQIASCLGSCPHKDKCRTQGRKQMARVLAHNGYSVNINKSMNIWAYEWEWRAMTYHKIHLLKSQEELLQEESLEPYAYQMTEKIIQNVSNIYGLLFPKQYCD